MRMSPFSFALPRRHRRMLPATPVRGAGESPVTATKPKGPIPLRTIMAFSLATAPVGALSTPLLVNLPPYYAGLLGLSLSAVGLIFGAVKLLDIFVDPAIGMLMDRTRTRLGRYRVWLIASAPIL